MPALPDFGTEQSDSSKLPDFGEALPDFGEPSPAQAPDLSQIKPSPVSEIEAPATAEPLSIMSRGGPSVFDLAKGAMSIAGKVGGGLIRTATQLVNPETWQPNEERIRQNASFGESPQQTAQRLDQQDPLKYEIQPGSPDENNELKRLLSRWTGAEGLSQFAIAANPVGGITMLTAMVPDLLGQVRDAVGGKGTDDEKRDRINDLMTLALLHAGKKTGELTGQQLSEGNRIANQPPLATGEVLSTPKGSAVPPKVPFELPNAARAPEPPVVPTAPPARTPMTQEEHASVYPVIKSDALVDGREQLNPDRVPNVSSIESSIDNPQILPGIREVPMSDFTLTGKHYSVEGQKKIDALAESIKDSGKISPLIVVRDSEGAYILEGATRADALFKLGAKSFPAKVVLDIGDIEKTKAPVVPTKAEAPPVAPVVEAAAKPEVATLGGAKSNNKLGDPMGTTYHATPEDWAKWQELLSKPLMEEGVWPAREALKNAYGGMPPEAPKVAAAPPAPAEAAHAVAPRQARTAPSGMTGMGGAVPSEFGGNESFVSNMFAAIDRDRAEMGKPPMGDTRPHTWDEANQKALAMMNQNPNWIPDLLDKMEKNPRPLSQEENAAVVWHRAKLKAEYNNSLQRIALAFDDNRTEDLTAAKVDAAVFEDKLARLDGIVGRNGTGSEAGRRLQALKMGAGDDFTLVEMTLQKRAAVGGRRLTPEETSSIQKDVDRLNSLNAALEKSLADSDAKASAAEAERAIAELKIKDIPTFDKRILVAAERMVARLETVAKPHAAQLREMMSRMSAGVDPTLIYHAAFVGSAKIARLGLDLAKFTDEMVSDFSEKIRPMIPEIWAESNKMLDALKVPNAVKRIIKKTDLPGIKQDAANAVKEKTSKGELSKITWEVQKLARALVSHGITDREELITAVHEALAKAVPGLTRRKTMDMISGYGDYRRLSKDVISVQLRGMKGEMLELAKLEDMASGQPPLKSGVERGETTEVRRKLIQLVNDAKNKFQVPIENPETQLKSSLDTLKTALKNRITDYQDRLERKDYAPRPRREVQMDTEATRLRADAERIKKRWRESLLADRMKNRTRWEKALDWGTKFRRFTALSSPAVIPKLFGAAGWRAVFTVAEDVSGGVLGRVPGLRGISQRAPLEGAGGQLSATMRGFGAAFTQGLKDTAKVIKTGHSDIDVLYGKASESYTGESEMASVLLGLPGRLHGAIKAPVKRGMFEKATQRLGEYYARQALDVTSDPVKYKIAIEAYKAGNRSIFLQDNRVASGFNAALQALEKKGETGHPSPGGKVLATTARFMFPVTKVPTNIAAETLQYTTGSVTGSVRAINAIRKGLDNLTPDQADLIMRELKKGYVGLALLYLGYMGYKSVGGVYEQGKKRQPGDVKPDAVRIFGEDIPGNLLHHPSINTIQLGATIHRTAEDKLRRKDPDAQGITAGVMAASWGLAEEVPFIQGPSRLFQGLKSPYTRQQTVGNEVGSVAIPQAVAWLAQVLDQRRETPPANLYQRVTGPPARLKPANVLESLKTRIPGLRQQVPLNPKGAPTAAPAAAVPPWDQFRK
jgi:hypothetical protein